LKEKLAYLKQNALNLYATGNWALNLRYPVLTMRALSLWPDAKIPYYEKSFISNGVN
jgi:hypothetical protein